jgi:hypothetical protein
MTVKCDGLWGLKYISTITTWHKQNNLETSVSQNMTAGAEISKGYNILRKALTEHTHKNLLFFLCPRIILFKYWA